MNPKLEYDSDVRLLGEVGVLSVSGETDMHTAPRFRSDLMEAMQVAPGDLVLDLSALEFMDSTALNVLILARDTLSRQDRSLILVVDGGHLRRLFEITGLESVFVIEDNLRDAVDWARSRPHGYAA